MVFIICFKTAAGFPGKGSRIGEYSRIPGIAVPVNAAKFLCMATAVLHRQYTCLPRARLQCPSY